MYENSLIDGTSLADRSICLTFDDGPGETAGPGPGPRTLALAQYLNQQGVPATFFMVGKFASALPQVMARVKSLGHLIGNHSYDHPNLLEYAEGGGDIVAQISRTESLIRHWVDGPVVMMRPPHGAWNADIAARLNANLTVSLGHIGPVGWDIDGGDWSCWQDGRTPGECAERYLQLIEHKRRGIVLFHDCTSDREVIKRANRTLEAVQFLIPTLRERGYSFVRLDQVPAIASRARTTLRVALRGINGLYISPPNEEGGPMSVDAPLREAFEVEDLRVGKVALRSWTGYYISPQSGGGGNVLAKGVVVKDWEPLDLISLENYRVAFRTVTGHFLSCEPGESNLLKADTYLLKPSSMFTYEFVS